MKKIILTICTVSCFFLALGQVRPEDKAYKYILDYQVPTSPAFMLLDVNPEQVTRGSAAKPLVANLFSNFLQTGKLEPGLAMDFSPYFLLGGRLKNVDDYQDDWWKRLAVNTLLSVATLKNADNPNNLDHSVAGRITFFDRHDLFNGKNRNLTNNIGTALARAAPPPQVGAGLDPVEEVGTAVPVPSLSQIYQEAYDALRDVEGSALSIGFGYKGTALNSELRTESITNQEYRIWGAFTQYAIFKGIDLRTIALGRFGKGLQPEWKTGVALASPNKNSNMGAELVYNFMNNEFEYGATFEIRLLKQLVYCISFSKRSFVTNRTYVDRLRAISTFRYDLFGK